MAKAQDMDDVATGGGDNNRKPLDQVEAVELKPKKYVALRPLGPVYSYGGHWIGGKSKKDGKQIRYYTPCSAWDPEENVRKGNYGSEHCAWCRHEQWEHTNQVDPKHRLSRFARDNWMNVIQRSIQKKGPGADAGDPTKAELKTKFKDKDSDTWTPVRAFRASPNLLGQIKDLRQLNNQEDAEGNRQAFPVSHPKYGADIMVLKDEDKPPAQYYTVQMGEQNALRKSELAYLTWDLSDMVDYPTPEQLEADYKKTMIRMGKDPDEADDEAGAKPKKGKKAADDEDDEDAPPKAKKKKPVVDDDDEDDDEDEAPKPKKKPVKKVVDDDDEDADDDEDEPPKPKKKVAKKPAFDDSEDDEDDDPPPKPKKKPVKKAADEDDDEDEDDDPPAKAKKPVKKVAKKVVDDEDDEEDDPPPKAKKRAPPPDDDEDDEDDAPKPKKKPVKKAADDEDDEDEPPAKPKKKPVKKVVDDDDEDEDEAPKPKKKGKKVVDEDEDDDL